jgi:uncharacterized protein YbjT (DUF2867 family)
MSALLVLGGSGRTGVHVLRHAVDRGHRVRALVRNPDALEVPAGVELVTGTPEDVDDIRRAAEGVEAVVSTLNNARASDNPWAKPVSPPHFMTDATRSTLAVMSELGIGRFVATSTQGVADDWTQVNPVMRAMVRLSNIRLGFDDHNGVDALLRESDVDWTLARAVALTDKPQAGSIRAALRGDEKPATWVNRADLAAFLLDTVEQGTWIGQSPLVWNAKV